MSQLELIGILASAIVLCSTLFRTTTFKGTILMRSINIVGSCLFVIYGFVLPAYAVAAMNAAIIFIHIVFIIVETKNYRKYLKNKNKEKHSNEI